MYLNYKNNLPLFKKFKNYLVIITLVFILALVFFIFNLILSILSLDFCKLKTFWDLFIWFLKNTILIIYIDDLTSMPLLENDKHLQKIFF